MRDLNRYSPAAKILSLKMTGQVGPRTFGLLMAHFITVNDILLAEEAELMELPGIGPGRSGAIFKADGNLDQAQTTLDDLEASDTKAVTCLDDDYPSMLTELNDPPLILYFKGRLPATHEKRVAIIGSQEVSAEGIGDAVKLAKRLVHDGVAIIGGLARGIDTAGHMGALKAEGATYAVLPCGFNQIYPAENESLAVEISRTGGLISEYLPDTPVKSSRLLNRNRLIVGLSQAVVIGEMSPESVGTLDAALCCHHLGKLLFAVVGDHNRHLDKLAEYGAIPLTGIDQYAMILSSLV